MTTMAQLTVSEARRRFALLRVSQVPIVEESLLSLWDALPTVDARDVLGDWKGFAFVSGHPVEALLERSGWYGKRFVSLEEAQPLICRGSDGVLYSDRESGRGEASLWNVEFRGEVTASMVYDGQAVVDHFKQVDENTLMGVMNGKAQWVRHRGRHFWFGLERIRSDEGALNATPDLNRN